ncbi:MAG: InlB B-repeat-containing protein [Clostridia bacterium]|nr:InlB B-repeat-containing protein [Clostridia bacterium]
MIKRKNALNKILSYLLIFSIIASLPLGISSFAATVNGKVDFESYKLGYPQTSENGIILSTDKKNAVSGKKALRYGYEWEVSNAKDGAFALLSLDGSKTIELKPATQYQVKFKYMLKGSTACSVDLSFFASSALTPNSPNLRSEIGRAEKAVTVTTKKNVWLQKTVNIATDEVFKEFSGDDCNALAIGFNAYIDSGMGTGTFIYLDDVEIKEIGTAPTYTIKFETNGGNAVASISGLLNKEIVLPQTPVKENYVFAGWYTDKALTNKFSDGIFTRNLTLYAKWIASSGYYIDFNSDSYDAPYKDSAGVQTAISKESFNSPGKSLKYRDIGAYGARRLLITENGERVTVKDKTLYKVSFSYRNYSRTPAYFEAMTSGTSLYTGTQVFGGTFVLSKEDEWKHATYYFYTELFSPEENYLVFYITGDDNNKSDIFIDDIEITEVATPKNEPVTMIIDYSDGENSTYMTGKEDAPLSIKEPKRDGYKFISWSEDNWHINEFWDDGFYFSKRIYAKWAKLKQIQNFDDTYDHTGISLGYDLDMEIYDATKSGNKQNDVVSAPNSMHRIGDKNLKKAFTLFDDSMEPLVPDQNYLVTFAVKVDELDNADGEILIAHTTSPDYAWSCDDDSTYFVTMLSDLPKGKWVKVSYLMTVFDKYLSVFTTGNNSVYFDDFTIEWMPDDAQLPSGESVEISKLDVNTEILTGDDSASGSLSDTGDSSKPLQFVILAVVSAGMLAVIYCYRIKKRRQNDE